MKTKMKKLLCVLLAAVLCLGMSVPTMAASSKYKAAVKAYRKYESRYRGNGKIVDLDKNGIPELLYHNQTKGRNEIYTYNAKTKKMKLLVKVSYGGKAGSYPIKYSVKKHTVLMMQADTGGSNIYVYRIKGLKKTKLLKATYENGKFARFDPTSSRSFSLNGKKVSEAKYNQKLNSYMKYMKDLKIIYQY